MSETDTGTDDTNELFDAGSEGSQDITEPSNPPSDSQPSDAGQGGAGEASQPDNAPSNPQSPDNTQPAPSSQPAQPISAKEIAEATARAVAGTLAQGQQQQKQRGMTQEEYNKTFNRTVLQEQMVESLLSPDTPIANKVQLLQAMLDGAANHAVARANFIINHQIQRAVQQYQSEIAPFKQEYSTRQQAATRKAFIETYPGFDETQHKDIIGASAMAVNKEVMAMSEEARNALTDKQVMEMVANKAADIIRKVNPNFNPKARADGVTPAPSGASKVPGATRRSFPTGAKVDTTKVKTGTSKEDEIDDLFNE